MIVIEIKKDKYIKKLSIFVISFSYYFPLLNKEQAILVQETGGAVIGGLSPPRGGPSRGT